jgi:O-antigen/teichoic acid export membrane protein
VTVKPTASTNSQQHDRRHLFRGSLLNIGGFLLRMASRVPFLFIAGQLYGTARYGEYVLATALIESAAVIGNFGFKLTLFRFLHEAEDHAAEDVVRHVLALTLGLAVILATAIWAGSAPLAHLFGMPGAAPKIAFLAWVIPAIVITDLVLAATWNKRVVHFEVIARSIVEPATLTVSSFVLFHLGFPEMGLPFAFAAAFTFAAVAALISFARCYSIRALFGGGLRWSYLVHLARRSASTSLHDIIALLFNRIDVLVVGYFFDNAAVGLYGMAQQFLTVMEKITLSFSPVLIPVLTEALKGRDVPRARHQLFAVARRILVMQTPIVLLFLVAGPFLLKLIGPGFVDAWGILMVLTLGAWANGALGLTEFALLSIRPLANPQASLVRLALYAAIVVPLKAVFGPIGVALSNVLATLAANFMRTLVCRPALRALAELPS